MKNKKNIILFLFFIPLHSFSHTGPLQNILQQVEQKAITLLIEETKIEALRGKNLAAQGAFDFTLKGEIMDRLDGYYKTQEQTIGIERKIPFMASQLGIYYKRGIGDFPLYEDEKETLIKGEIGIKGSLSLLKNRQIDPKRFKREQTLNDLNVGQWLFDLKKQKIFKEILSSFFEFVFLNESESVAKEMILLAENNIAAVQQSIKKGDLPAIYEVEAQQYLIKRQQYLLEIQQEKINVTQYWKSLNLDMSEVPLSLSLRSFFTGQDILAIFDKSHQFFNEHPYVKGLDSDIYLLKRQVLMSEQNRLPELNLISSFSRDQGQGPKRLQGNEWKIGLSLYFPIERSESRGELIMASSELMKKEREKTFFESSFFAQIQQLQSQIPLTQQSVDLAKKETELCIKLIEAEKKRFLAGSSDFFLLNIREQNMAESKLKFLKSEFLFLKLKLEIMATFNLLSTKMNW
jgi:hypothetical protein